MAAAGTTGFAVAGLFLLGLGFISCETLRIYGAMSGNVTLSLPSPILFTEVLWKKGKDKVAEWDEKDLIRTYPPFKNRVHLDTVHGNLTIFNLTLLDEDEYEVEFFSLENMIFMKVLSKKFVLKILEPLPSPILNCSVTDRNITVTCRIPENNYSHPNLVNYSWHCHSAQCNYSVNPVMYFEKEDVLSQEVQCIVSDPVDKRTSSIILGSCVQDDLSRHRYLLIPAFVLPASIVLILKVFPKSSRNREPAPLD
ncbi:lymphocyte function-associated antigen 3 isoform 1-T2 [Hipposideros larvatus]